MQDLIAIFDETGTNNRPGLEEESGFGVGGIIFDREMTELLAKTSREIGKIVDCEDFKYRHVIKDAKARSKFINFLRGNPSIRIYAFYSQGPSILREQYCAINAQLYYEQVPQEPLVRNSENENTNSSLLLSRFIGFMAPQIANYGKRFQRIVNVYWDRRTDLETIQMGWEDSIRKVDLTRPEAGLGPYSAFLGQATGSFQQITRLAGVLAGDIRKFFVNNHTSIFQHLKPDGLVLDSDPYFQDVLSPLPTVATICEPLVQDNPFVATENGVMLQGYYKSFLKKEKTGEYLISFADPKGHLGILLIEHGSKWHITQLPD